MYIFSNRIYLPLKCTHKPPYNCSLQTGFGYSMVCSPSFLYPNKNVQKRYKNDLKWCLFCLMYTVCLNTPQQISKNGFYSGSQLRCCRAVMLNYATDSWTIDSRQQSFPVREIINCLLTIGLPLLEPRHAKLWLPMENRYLFEISLLHLYQII